MGEIWMTRRDFLQLSAAATVAALVPATVAAAPPPDKKPGGSPPPSPLQDPYTGVIPITFPLAEGVYRKPVNNNWHDNRDGDFDFAWSHQNSTTQRAHDGVDIFPRFSSQLPPVYAPFQARVAAVNDADSPYRESVHEAIRPPWTYPADGATNIYGNYVWLYSMASDSLGYFMFYCHLQNEMTITKLAEALNQANAANGYVEVGIGTEVGRMGESGNATGQPQLHLELHYPKGHSFTCTRCDPDKGAITAFNPFSSLSKATTR